jgi:drug/metabolite transporter (DMT)-like permease
MNKRSHIFMLFLATIFWGTTFVAQRIGAEHVGAYTYLAGRSWIAVVFLTPVVHAFDRFHDRRGTDNRRPRSANARKQLILASITAGVALCAASAAQQIGVAYTTASKAGFITALYVVLVPILSIFIGKRPSAHIWACVALALVGMYLLCITGGDLKLQIGDAYELACALLFAVEILLVYHFSPLVDGVRLSRMMFLVVAVLSTVLMFVLESPTWESVRAALPAIAYAGIISSGIGYTLQILGQEGVNPTVASLVMSFESVFSALSGWLVLGERLNPRELTGAALMFVDILLSQVEIRPKRA